MIDHRLRQQQIVEREYLLQFAENISQEIVQLVANGKTAVEIGLILGIGQRTVFDHLKNAKAKAGVYKETALVAQAMRGGWVA